MALLQNIDPDGLFEYSVVFTDRSLNHMSQNFQSVMKSLSTNLKKVYGAEGLALIPGEVLLVWRRSPDSLLITKMCL